MYLRAGKIATHLDFESPGIYDPPAADCLALRRLP
jgi:hypothetical protein